MSKNFVCGDIHVPWDIKKLNTKMWPDGKDLTKEDILFQLGDFGGLWYPVGVNKEQEYLII